MNVFLSHSHRDREFARRLSNELAGLGFEVWDETQIIPGTNWGLEVGRALDQSDAMIVLISPDYVASESARRELEYALVTPKYAGRLIPVLLKPTGNVPWVLNRIQWLDATQDREGVSKRIAEALRASREVCKS